MKYNCFSINEQIFTASENGVLYLKNKKQEGGGNCKFTLNVPKNITIKTELGAGQVTLKNLTSDLDISLGAGNVNIDAIELPSKTIKLNLKTGAGKINILLPLNSRVHYAKRPSVGWGQVNLSVPETEENTCSFLISVSNGVGDLTIKKHEESTY